MEFKLKGEILEEGESFKYLGAIMAANLRIESDVSNWANEECEL